MESACFMWNPVSALPPPYFPGSAYLSSRAGLSCSCFFWLRGVVFPCSPSLEHGFLFPSLFPFLLTAMEAKHIAALFQVMGLHFTQGSAGTFVMADGGNRMLDWSPKCGSPAANPEVNREPCGHWPSWGELGGLTPDCTCLCHFTGCNTTELSLNKQHTRNIKVLPTGQNGTGIFEMVNKIKQEQSYWKRLCLITLQASGRKA